MSSSPSTLIQDDQQQEPKIQVKLRDKKRSSSIESSTVLNERPLGIIEFNTANDNEKELKNTFSQNSSQLKYVCFVNLLYNLNLLIYFFQARRRS